MYWKSTQSRLFVVFVAGVLGLWGMAGCDSGGGGGDEEKSGSIGSQVAAGSSGQKEKAEKGASGIDHGGITKVPTDEKLVKKGEEIFKDKGCGACHATSKRKVGPPLGGVTDRREPEWIAKMIQHPREMLKKDPTARKMLAKYGARMSDQDVTPEQARALLAYLGTLEKSSGEGEPKDG